MSHLPRIHDCVFADLGRILRARVASAPLVRSWILERMREEPSIADLATRLERVEQKVGLR